MKKQKIDVIGTCLFAGAALYFVPFILIEEFRWWIAVSFSDKPIISLSIGLIFSLIFVADWFIRPKESGGSRVYVLMAAGAFTIYPVYEYIYKYIRELQSPYLKYGDWRIDTLLCFFPLMMGMLVAGLLGTVACWKNLKHRSKKEGPPSSS